MTFRIYIQNCLLNEYHPLLRSTGNKISFICNTSSENLVLFKYSFHKRNLNNPMKINFKRILKVGMQMKKTSEYLFRMKRKKNSCRDQI